MSPSLRIKRMKEEITLLTGKSWMQYVWLFLITLLAAGLRIYKLGAWSFWIDEIYTINHAIAHFSTPQLILENIPPNRNWVPVSVISTAQVLNVWGVHEWSARLASASIGILTIPILYAPTKKVFGSHVTLIAMLLLAVSPWHIFWSQNARFYTALMLFYSLALFSFYFGIEKDEPKYLFLFFILVYFAASERLIALFIFPAVILYLAALWILRFEKPKGINIRNITIIALPILIGGIVELYSRIVKGESRFFADFTWFTQYQIDDPFRLLVFIGNNLGIPLMIMAIFSGLMLIGKKSRPGLLMTGNAMGTLFLLVFFNLFIFTKDRYIFITLFSWIILTAVGIRVVATVLKGNLRWLTLGIIFVFFAHAANDSLLYYQANHGNRLQWKSAFMMVKERSDETDAIIAFWPEFGPYYADREIIAYTDVEVDTLLESKRRYWFILDSETIWLNSEVKFWLEDNAELINVWYLRRPEDNFLRVYLFDPIHLIGP